MTKGFGGNALTPPVGERDHASGSAEAPLTLVEYGDFECPYTRRARPVVERLGRDFGGRLRFVYRHFPLTQIHPHARHAAEAAEAAASQGRFWDMHDMLLDNQRHLDAADLVRYAAELGLDVARFERELSEHAHAGRVREDLESAMASGLTGTPAFFVNGVRHRGSYRFGDLLGAVEAAARVPEGHPTVSTPRRGFAGARATRSTPSGDMGNNQPKQPS